MIKRFLEEVADEMNASDISLPEVLAEAQRRLEEGVENAEMPRM